MTGTLHALYDGTPGAQPGAESAPDASWCPAVGRTPSSYAEILADFPLPFADAESGTFRACRNVECYSLSLSDLTAANGPSPASVTGAENGATVEVWADREVIGVPKPASAPPTPDLKLRWDHPSDPTDFTRADEYTLSVDSPGTTSLLDTTVSYVRTTYTDLLSN